MNDLVWILSRLIDLKGNIQIVGLNELVAPLTDEELKLYDNIDFDLDSFRKDIDVEKLTVEDKKQVLMNRWRYPSLSIHGRSYIPLTNYILLGIEGAFHGPGAKTVIPAKVFFPI